MLNLIVDTIYDETDRIRVFTFRDAAGNAFPSYESGAHLEFDLGNVDLEENKLGKDKLRSYSLIDWEPNSSFQQYTVAVQREEEGNGGSKAMHCLKVGQSIQASLPSNNFNLTHGDAPVLLLAGGIGVTPLISMASELRQQNRAFSFHYSARNSDLMGFQDRLADTFNESIAFYFDDKNPLDIPKLMAQQSPLTHLYLCGPKGMIDAARSAAIDAGHCEENIHIELFSAPETRSEDRPFEVEIHSTGEVFTIPIGKTIIDILENAGKDIVFDCQRGDCGICQTDVISGTPDHRDVVLSESDRASCKVMQICVSRAISPRLVLDI